MIFAQTLPGVHASNVELFIGVAVVVVVNAAATLYVARRAVTIENALALFGARLLFNIVFVALAEWLLGRGDDLDTVATFFFLMLISLITTLHDRFLPVLEYRQEDQGTNGLSTGGLYGCSNRSAGIEQLKTGEVAERSIAADCKSAALAATEVRTLPSPPILRSLNETSSLMAGQRARARRAARGVGTARGGLPPGAPSGRGREGRGRE